MSRKLWVARICVALVVWLLFIASSYAFEWWKKMFSYTWSMPWGFFGTFVLLEVIAGVLLGISPEVFFNLRKVRFSPKELIVLAIIPIIVLIYIIGDFARIWFIGWYIRPPPYIYSYLIVTLSGLITSPIWIGVAIGKALHIRRGEVK